MATRNFKTDIAAMSDIKNVLEMSDVKTNATLTGDIFLMNRKLNSDKEDIVINTIVAGSEQISIGFFNINIHVPNLKNQTSGVPNSIDNTQPNIPRMEDIGNLVMEVMDDYRGDDFFIQLESFGEVIPNNGKWYYNIVLRYQYLRTDKN